MCLGSFRKQAGQMKRQRILNNTMWQYVNLAGPQLKPQHISLNENTSAVILQST